MTKGAVRIRQEGTEVLVIDVDSGRSLLHVPYNAALLIAQELHRVAKLAEEIAKHEEVVYDQAILYRSQALPPNIGLTANPVLRTMAVEQALYDKDLRRYISRPSGPSIPGIVSREAVGTPSVLKGQPKWRT